MSICIEVADVTVMSDLDAQIGEEEMLKTTGKATDKTNCVHVESSQKKMNEVRRVNGSSFPPMKNRLWS